MGVILCAHPIRSESHIQRNSNKEVATLTPVQKRFKPKPRCSWKDHSRKVGPISEMKVRSLTVLCNHSTYHWWSTQSITFLLWSSDELMSSCAAGISVSIWDAVHSHLVNRNRSAEWSRCPDSVAWCARDSMAPMWRSSAGWMPARIRSLSAGVGRRHPVTVRKASLMTRTMRRVWAVWHQSSILLLNGPELRWLFAVLLPQPEPASHLKSAPHHVSFVQSDLRCQRYIRTSCPMLLRGIWDQSERGELHHWSYFQPTFTFLVVELEDWQLFL